MARPITVDIPHELGRAGARERLEARAGGLAGLVPGGAVVERRWEGDTLHLAVEALGQRVACRAEVLDAHVRAEIELPAFLALFADRIRAKLERDGPALLR